MKKEILCLSAMLFFMATLNTMSAQYLFPPGDALLFPNLSIIDSEQVGYPDIVFYPQPAAAASPLVSVNSGDWSNPTTWDCGCVPAAINDIVIAEGTTVQMASSEIHNLTIEEGGVLEGGGT